MATNTIALTARPAWKALEAHYTRMCSIHLRTLFAEDPQRGERFAAEGAGIYLDYSKHRITDQTLRLLFALAEEALRTLRCQTVRTITRVIIRYYGLVAPFLQQPMTTEATLYPAGIRTRGRVIDEVGGKEAV